MKVDLAVIGQGAVTPAGVGLNGLNRLSVLATKPIKAMEGSDWPALRVDLKAEALARWQREPRLRRASAISYFMVEAAEQALAGVSAAARAETGIIAAFSAGPLAYSRRFFEGVITQGMASPALFPETVYNSPVSHVATVLGLNGAAYALVGDESAWVAALITASVWLKQERVRQVVVLGAEEFDPICLDAYRSARWLRRGNPEGGFLAAEGAGAILVRRAEPADAQVISHARDGWIYRTKKEAAVAAESLLGESDPALPCHRSAQRNWLGPLEKKATAGRPSFPDAPYLGEAFTASAAWHTLRALNALSPQVPRLLQPVWGLNHQLGLLALEGR